MHVFFIYNGSYSKKIAGAEIRYIKLAEAALKRGDTVTVGVRDVKAAVLPTGAMPVSLFSFFQLWASFLKSDLVLIHGGQPHVIFIAAVFAIFSKKTKILLDAYSPHWIELNSIAGVGGFFKRLKTRLKIAYNYWRVMLASSIFSGIIVANQRQLDLVRGVAASFGGAKAFDKVLIAPFGSDPAVTSRDRQALMTLLPEHCSENDFYIGWLGGMWPWMKFDQILPKILNAMDSHSGLRFVLFGSTDENQKAISSQVSENLLERFIFVSWIDYESRLKFWSGLDLAIVWGGVHGENDYSSRTRNFDCISALVPILQNYDDDWGPVVRQENLGLVCEVDDVEEALSKIIKDPVLLKTMSENMLRISREFSWGSRYELISGSFDKSKKGNIGAMFFKFVSAMFVGLFLLFAAIF